MRCPRCDTSSLDERERDGVTIDVCLRCRGIWLDRGELEKLVARERRDYQDYYADYDRYREQKYPRATYTYKRPKTFFEQLGDIFD